MTDEKRPELEEAWDGFVAALWRSPPGRFVVWLAHRLMDWMERRTK